MKNAVKLSKNLIKLIETHSEKYVTDEGKDIVTEDFVASLNSIVEQSLTLYKHIVDKTLCMDSPEIQSCCNSMNKLLSELTINQTNAEKLTLSQALIIWNRVKICGALMACSILDYKEQE